MSRTSDILSTSDNKPDTTLAAKIVLGAFFVIFFAFHPSAIARKEDILPFNLIHRLENKAESQIRLLQSSGYASTEYRGQARREDWPQQTRDAARVPGQDEMTPLSQSPCRS